MPPSNNNQLHISESRAEAINVVVRCRGRNDREIASKSDVVVDVPNKTGSKEVSISSTDNYDSNGHHNGSGNTNGSNNSSNNGNLVGNNKTTCKTFTVDQVFGPGADQELVFNSVASPLFDDFVKGFNCTIFAYGQTGTGKTYTMCGEDKVVNGSFSPNAGIIPRIMFKLFETLNKDPNLQKNDFVVKCSLVEIYNESLKDLLNPKGKKELKIYEEQSKPSSSSSSSSSSTPGTHAVYIKDLEEVCIRDPVDGLQILHKGLIDRKTSATNMNKNSSRSHTIFSISLYKTTGEQGDDSYRFSKMNLVDLAGSENISRSGATEIQAKEAGSINRSLLSLGKVINALVDSNLPPYRDSKLTRLLKDSLGGDTKTVLIANISPSQVDSEETSKTLEYASKAKNVMNTPQVGNMMLKNAIVKDLVDDVTRLRKDLAASWSKDGIMLAKENYDQLQKDAQQYKIQVDEANRKLEFQQNQNQILSQDLNNKMGEMTRLKDRLKDLQQVNNILNGKVQKQQNNERVLYDSTKKYRELIAVFNESLQKFENHQAAFDKFMKHKVEENLVKQAQNLISLAETSLKETTKNSVNQECQSVETMVQSMIQEFRKSALEICDSSISSFTATLPIMFDDLKKQIAMINNVTKKEISSFESCLDKLSHSNDDFDNYMTTGLFNNHEEIFNRHIDAINLQNEASKKEFIGSFIKLFETSFYNKTSGKLPAQITDLRKQIIDSERDLLSGKKYEWKKQQEMISQEMNNVGNKISMKIDENSDQLADKIDDMKKITTNSEVILKEERDKVASLISNLEQDKRVHDQLSQIESRFDKNVSNTQEAMGSVVTVADSLQTTSYSVRNKINNSNNINFNRDTIAQLSAALDMNEKAIDSGNRSRNTSPIRFDSNSLTITTPRRGSSSSNVLTTTTAILPGSRTSSRAGSRTGSPTRNDKENGNGVGALKRKQSSSDELEPVMLVPGPGPGVSGVEESNENVMMNKSRKLKPLQNSLRYYQNHTLNPTNNNNNTAATTKDSKPMRNMGISRKPFR